MKCREPSSHFDPVEMFTKKKASLLAVVVSILISVSFLQPTNVYAFTPWYLLYRDPAKLNDAAIWRNDITDLMDQLSWQITDNTYKSEYGAILSGLTRIENPEVVELIWNFFKKNSDPKLADAALQSVLAVAEKNKLMQGKVFNEFLTLTDPATKYLFSFSMLRWEEPPVEAVKSVFQSLGKLPLKDRIKKLNDLSFTFVNRKNDNPIKHLDIYIDEVNKLLMTSPADEEIKSLARMSAQLAKWSHTPYANILELYSSGKLEEKRFLAIFNTLSYEITGTIGATLPDLPTASIDNLFEIARRARLDKSPAVRAAVAEFVIRQSFGKHLPEDLRTWVQVELPNDADAFRELMKFYNEASKAVKASIMKKFPSVFDKASGFSFKSCVVRLFKLRK